jgi:hypothetical protein
MSISTTIKTIQDIMRQDAGWMEMQRFAAHPAVVLKILMTAV